MGDPVLLLIMLGVPFLSQWVSRTMRQRFVRFSKTPFKLSGREVAELMLKQKGIEGVQVISTGGQLTDHYDPRNRTVNLSQVVYDERNVAAAAVAAHECGHAIQHASNYPMLMARSRLVPFLKISNMAIPVLALGGAGISAAVGQTGMMLVCVFALGAPALFSLVTLPVEFNASSRALSWMEEAGLANGSEQAGAKKALFWAAMTYVIAALGSIAQALYFARMFMRRR